MSITRLLARVRGRIAFWAVAGTALLVSHDAIFLAQVGPGAALARVLRQAGHDYWGTASLALLVIGLGALVGTLARLHSLRRRAHALRASPVSGERTYFARWMAVWIRLLPLVAIGFLVQENAEHFLVHGHVPVLGALLGPEYPLALPVIGLVTAVAALIAAALGQTEHALLAVIDKALRRLIGHAPRRTLRPPLRLVVVLSSPLAHSWAGRGPPRMLVSAI